MKMVATTIYRLPTTLLAVNQNDNIRYHETPPTLIRIYGFERAASLGYQVFNYDYFVTGAIKPLDGSTGPVGLCFLARKY